MRPTRNDLFAKRSTRSTLDQIIASRKRRPSGRLSYRRTSIRHGHVANALVSVIAVAATPTFLLYVLTVPDFVSRTVTV